MKKAGGIWLPDEDTYFSKLFSEGKGFQLDRLESALSYVHNPVIAIDGGAHVGSWSVVMAEVFEAVFSFEPAKDTYECLTKNTEFYDNVRTFNYALSNTNDSTAIVHNDTTRKGNTGSRYVTFGTNGSGSIPTITIDSLSLMRVDFLKLDLEGAELLALQGAVKTLQRCRPVIFVEAKKGMAERFGGVTGDSLDFLRKLGAKQVEKFGSDYVFTM
jgi:FkbM family methyltransferase